MSDGNATLRFYYPLPAYGVKMARQWPMFREDFQALAPLVRAAYVDLQPASAHDPGENDLSGWAIGERDFRNKFRIWYSKTEDMFKIQYNNGTEATPAWNDAIQIRESDLRVIITGSGGLSSPTGGFYTDIPRNVALSRSFTSSTEWQFNHNLNAKPVLWNAFRTNDTAIVPAKVDVSDPNTAYFYFSVATAGKAIVTAEQARGNGINFSDGNNIYYNKLKLNANSTDFYFSRDLQGNPVLNLMPVDLSESQHSSLGGLTADDHPQYARTDGTRDITGPQKFNKKVTTAASFYSTTNGEVAYANQGYLTVRQTAGSTEFSTVNRISFAQESFYITADTDGKPIVNLRGSTGSGSSGQFGTGIATGTFSSSTEWALNHGIGAANIIWAAYDSNNEAIIPNKVATSNPNIAYFYFTEAVSGKAVVAGGPVVNSIVVAETDGTPSGSASTLKFSSTDFYIEYDSSNNPVVNLRGSSGGGSGGGVTAHSALTGLTADDHTQYLLASQATDRATFTANWTDLTDGGETTLHTHPASGGSADGGFYAKMSDGTGFGDTVLFSTADFNKSGQTLTVKDSGIDHSSLANLTTGDPHTQYSLADGTRAFTGTVGGITPTSSSHLATKGYVDSAVGPGFYGIFIQETDGNPGAFKKDTIIFDSASFYLNPDSKGRPIVSFRGSSGTSLTVREEDGSPSVSSVSTIRFTNGTVTDNGGGDVSVAITAGGITVTDDTHTYSNKSTVGLNAKHFYLSQSAAGNPVINLRYDKDFLSVSMEAGSVGNTWVDPFIPYDYVVEQVEIDCKGGSAGCGFYLVSPSERFKNGTAITPMSEITISSTPQIIVATGNNSAVKGGGLLFSIYSNSASKQIRLTVTAKKPN